MNKGRSITIAALATFVLIALLPPIVHGYMYPSEGDDTAMHLQVFDKIANGETTEFIYYGQAIVGYPLVAINRISGTSIDSLFLWFNFIVFIGIGLTLYFVLSRIVNREAGLLAIPLATFCAHGIFMLFYSGTIFSIINVYIILPFAAYFIVKWITEKRKWQVAGAIVTTGTFMIFHPTGLLLPVLNVLRGKGGITVATQDASVPLASLLEFIFKCGTLLPLTIIAVTGIIIVSERLEIKRSVKLLIALLSSYIGLLAIAAITGLTGDPGRQAIDIATILAIIAACLAGVVITQYKRKLLTGVIIAGVIIGSIVPILDWTGFFGTKSAVKAADLEAIAYLNGLEYSTCNYSTQIAPWIYNRLLNKKQIEGKADFAIFRSEPMTARTDPGNRFYQYSSVSKPEDFADLKLLEAFEDGEVKVYVFCNS